VLTIVACRQPVTSRIKEQQPDTTRIIILTSLLDDERVVPAIKADATSYLLKDAAATDLDAPIRGARRPGAATPGGAKRLLQQVTSPRKTEAGAPSSRIANAKRCDCSPKAEATKRSPVRWLSASVP
jgi:DNA-binding NarL/FixJ family response regulator